VCYWRSRVSVTCAVCLCVCVCVCLNVSHIDQEEKCSRRLHNSCFVRQRSIKLCELESNNAIVRDLENMTKEAVISYLNVISL
jgi:hypothetical protein